MTGATLRYGLLGILGAAAIVAAKPLLFHSAPATAAAPHSHQSRIPCPAAAAPAELQRDLASIAHNFPGTVGIAVRRTGCPWVAGANTNALFPQQSVAKLWVTLTVLDAVDRGQVRLDDPLSITPADLTLFNQPLQWAVLDQGQVTLPVRRLISDALTLSDNTANERLLRRVGGPAQIDRTLARKGLSGIRFGPGEKALQSGIAGIRWQDSLSVGRNFENARAKLPMALRQKALGNYLANPADGATPAGITHALAKLGSGDLLSPASTNFVLSTMKRSRTGRMRLRGGLAKDWTLYHKTGTGQILGRVATGFNDVGLLEAPDGTRYAVAVMIAQTSRPIPERLSMMQSVSAAVGRHHVARSARR